MPIMAQPLSFHDLSLEKFSGTDPDEDALSFVTSIEKKLAFALGSPPADATALAIYNHRKRGLFATLLRGSAAEWYTPNIDEADAAHNWNHKRSNFVTRSTDGRDRYKVRLQAENSKRLPTEQIKTCFQRVKSVVDEGWPMMHAANANDAARQAAESTAQNSRNEKYNSSRVKELDNPALQHAAQTCLIEHPNATWAQFHTHVVHKDLTFAVNASFLSETTAHSAERLVTIEKELQKLQLIVQNIAVNAITLPPDTSGTKNNPRYRQNATRFSTHCIRNGHSIRFCYQKRNDDKTRRNESNYRNTTRLQRFSQNYLRRPTWPDRPFH